MPVPEKREAMVGQEEVKAIFHSRGRTVATVYRILDTDDKRWQEKQRNDEAGQMLLKT